LLAIFNLEVYGVISAAAQICIVSWEGGNTRVSLAIKLSEMLHQQGSLTVLHITPACLPSTDLVLLHDSHCDPGGD
jgi:hypothetical protein